MDESCSIQAPSSSCIKKNETTEVVSQKSNFEGSPQNVIDMRYSEIRDDKFINDYEYILVRANVEFLNKTYGSSIWNKEHYILITQKDKNTYYYLNDNPYDERVISKEMLDELSTKSAIGISLKRELIAGIDELKYFYDKLNKNNNKNKIDFNTSNESCLLQLRDALGVIRVMRKRNYYFISEYIDARFMEEYLKKLDSKYIKLEYKRLRKSSIDVGFINEFISELIKEDMEMVNIIKDKIGEKIC